MIFFFKETDVEITEESELLNLFVEPGSPCVLQRSFDSQIIERPDIDWRILNTIEEIK